jgi:protein-S-isoprenylcysteine O-methyltransferase Ste14
MALIHSFEKSGNYLFRNRSHIPIILFVLAVPVIYITDISHFSKLTTLSFQVIAISLSILGFIIRALTIGSTPAGTSGRNTKEGQVAEQLNTTGIYSIIRHPLYLGNYLMWIGIVIFTYNIYFVIIISLLYWLYYERIMFAEERFLEKKFGQAYLDWSMLAPAFFPAFSKYKKSNMTLSIKSILRREYSGVLATAFGFWFIDTLRYYFETSSFDITRISNFVLAVAIVLVIILRSLKHYTNVLNEKGRS